MKIDLEFLGALKKSRAFKTIDQIPKTDNVYEYSIADYKYGSVTGTLYLENEIIDQFDCIIGFFGVNFDHKVMAYNLKKVNINDNVKENKNAKKESD